jgi:hypothetical protein
MRNFFIPLALILVMAAGCMPAAPGIPAAQTTPPPPNTILVDPGQ